MKLMLDSSKIRENISMIELQVIENYCPGTVMNKFRALVKEGGVILIRFDDKER
ncbi:MAG: hypothetical protein JW384_03407 [Nitrosomonadaceae bacterium]|nr:hypothetical protein [Nitrosomonadaceae bacterium]